jgi:drug/metabolite transporter (DMT)-like permease
MKVAPIVFLTQTTNWIILAVIVFLAVYFVGRDARRKTKSWPETVAWVLASIFTFPLGFGLYFLLNRRTSAKA